MITSRIEHKLLNGIRVSKMAKRRMSFVDVQVTHRQFWTDENVERVRYASMRTDGVITTVKQSVNTQHCIIVI